jgi:hypothetical protein
MSCGAAPELTTLKSMWATVVVVVGPPSHLNWTLREHVGQGAPPSPPDDDELLLVLLEPLLLLELVDPLLVLPLVLLLLVLVEPLVLVLVPLEELDVLLPEDAAPLLEDDVPLLLPEDVTPPLLLLAPPLDDPLLLPAPEELPLVVVVESSEASAPPESRFEKGVDVSAGPAAQASATMPAAIHAKATPSLLPTAVKAPPPQFVCSGRR